MSAMPPESQRASGDQEEADDDAALVAETLGQKARRDRHQEVTDVVGELHEARLRFRDVQRVLEVLVQDVDHAVTEAPEQEQGSHQGEGDEQVLSVLRGE